MAINVKVEGAKETSEYFRKLRKEASRLSSIANKRLGRLKYQGYEDTPAFRTWENDRGGVKFGVRGKSNAEVQSEYWRVRHFLDNRTSTIRGANKVLKDIAASTGMGYSGMKDLKNKSKTFFQLAQRISEYDKSVERAAEALDYQKIWQQINTMVKMDDISLDYAEDSAEQAEIIDRYLDMFIKQYNKIVDLLK